MNSQCNSVANKTNACIYNVSVHLYIPGSRECELGGDFSSVYNMVKTNTEILCPSLFCGLSVNFLCGLL